MRQNMKLTLLLRNFSKEHNSLYKGRTANVSASEQAKVIISKSEVVLKQDMRASIPLYYKMTNKRVFISDNLAALQEFEDLNMETFKEFLNFGFVLKDETFFSGTRQVLAGQTVRINRKTGKVQKTDNQIFGKHISQATCSIEEVHNKVLGTFLSSNSSNKILLGLSGGRDSRVLACYLKKLNLAKRVIAYTIGHEKQQEVKIAQKIAEKLNFTWLRVSPDFQRNYSNVKMFEQGAHSTYLMHSVFESVKKIVNLDQVVLIRGDSADFVSGSRLKKYRRFDLDKVKEIVRQFKNFNCLRYSAPKSIDETLKNYFLKLKKKYDLSDYELLEHADWRERQAKLICPNTEILRFYKVTSYSPFFSRDYLDFWSRQPHRKRFNQTLYKDYTSRLFEKFDVNLPFATSDLPFPKNHIYNILINLPPSIQNSLQYIRGRISPTKNQNIDSFGIQIDTKKNSSFLAKYQSLGYGAKSKKILGNIIDIAAEELLV